ncbi:TRAP transporter large permease [Oscillibacter sp. GMB15532]|uniref:TRAP transporter large permease n=1 Tax=Oscillibacter sp. GMB15532 TaxID=3230022 RepID=UPI0034DEE78B
MNFIPLIILLVLFCLNIPIAYSLMVSVLYYFAFCNTTLAPFMIFQKMVAQGESFTLLAVPFFVSVGVIMNYSGIATRLMNVADMLTGRMVGGLAQSNVVLSALMGGVSGSANADAAMQSKMLVPEMTKRGYSKGFSAGVTAASSILTPIIPPGICLILYASLANVSVAKMFLAGYGPGIFLMICLMVTVHLVSKKKGYLGTRTTKVKLADALRTLREAFWALLIPLGIIMGLRMGVFTATEAGAICVFYCIFVGTFVYKELKISMFPQIIKECVVSTAGVMLIISAAASFGNYMSWEQIPTKLSEVLLTITTNKYVMLLLVNLFLLVVGMFLEGTASLIILTPLLVPTMVALGVDPILFGIVMCVNVTLGGITPPFGTLMFLTCSIIKVGIDRFLKESWMLILAMIIGLLAITYIPPITLLLPRLLG